MNVRRGDVVLVIGLGGQGNVAERAAFVSPLHVSAVETLPHTNGSKKRRQGP